MSLIHPYRRSTEFGDFVSGVVAALTACIEALADKPTGICGLYPWLPLRVCLE
jgi:hypothetical protein